MNNKAKQLSELTGVDAETIENAFGGMGLSIEDIDFSMCDLSSLPADDGYIDGLAIGTDAGIIYIPSDSEQSPEGSNG